LAPARVALADRMVLAERIAPRPEPRQPLERRDLHVTRHERDIELVLPHPLAPFGVTHHERHPPPRRNQRGQTPLFRHAGNRGQTPVFSYAGNWGLTPFADERQLGDGARGDGGEGFEDEALDGGRGEDADAQLCARGRGLAVGLRERDYRRHVRTPSRWNAAGSSTGFTWTRQPLRTIFSRNAEVGSCVNALCATARMSASAAGSASHEESRIPYSCSVSSGSASGSCTWHSMPYSWSSRTTSITLELRMSLQSSLNVRPRMFTR